MSNVMEFIGEDCKIWGQFIKNVAGTRESEERIDNVVFLSAPTGTGKTTFILKVFSEFVISEKKGRILILVPRTILQNQMQRILMNFFAGKNSFQEYVSSIQVMTYQALENAVLHGEYIGKFYAVICDEAHYFVEDALFNADVQTSFNWLCNFIASKQGLVICQSATLDLFQKILIETLDLKPINEEPDNNKQVNKGGRVYFSRRGEYKGGYYEYRMKRELPSEKVLVRYLVSRQEMEYILVHAEGKRLCFVSNKKHGEELQNALQNNHISAQFVTAENKETNGKDTVSSLVCDSKFQSDVLIATSVLDVGVNILDKNVSAVILESCDQTTFIQMLGRIRLMKEQKVVVYIFKRDVKYFKNWRENIVPRMQFQMDMLKIPKEYQAANIIEKLMQGNGYVDTCAFNIHGGKLQLNSLLQKKLSNQLVEFNEIIEGLEEDGEYFIKKQLSWLGLEDTYSVQNYASVANKKQRREEVIAAIRKKCMPSPKKSFTKNEISEVLQKIKEDVRSLNKECLRSNETLSVEKFRNICQNEQLPFYIVQREADRKQVYWLVDLLNE